MKKKLLNHKDVIIVILMMISVPFILLQNSPVHIWNHKELGTDSSIYYLTGLLMRKGYYPYRDFFCEKGPLIYWLDYLATFMGYVRGLFIIEYIVNAAVVYLIYRIARITGGVRSSIISLLLAGALLIDTFNGGNLTEEYAMPCIAFALLVFLDYLVNDHISKYRIITCGIALGFVIINRINMISVWLVFILVVIFKLAKEKEFIKMLAYGGMFTLGVFIVLGPTFVALKCTNSYDGFIRDYLIYGFRYTSPNNGEATLFNRWNAIFAFLDMKIITLTCAIIIVLLFTQYKTIHLIYAICFIVTLVLATVSGKSFPHYAMVFVPLVVFPVSVFLSGLEDRNKENRFLYASVLIALICVYISPVWVEQVQKLGWSYSNRNVDNYNQAYIDAARIICDNTDKNEKISGYGNFGNIYLLSNRVPATYFLYMQPLFRMDKDIYLQYYNEVKTDPPKLIAIRENGEDKWIDTILKDFNYELLWQELEDEPSKGVQLYIKR